MPILADQSSSWQGIVLWSSVLVVLLMVGMVVVAIARRSLYSRGDEDADVFTLHGLRKLHTDGAITEEEFTRAKAAIIERAKRAGHADSEDPAARAVWELRGRSDKAAPDAETDGTLSDEKPPNSG